MNLSDISSISNVKVNNSMNEYKAPLDDMNFVVNQLIGLPELANAIDCEDANNEILEAILTEANKLTSDVWSNTNTIGDRKGVQLSKDGVKVPSEFHNAYWEYVKGDWGSIYFEPEMGGQGLPFSFAMPISEMLQASNMALGLCPMLTAGAIETLQSHASDELKAKYLPKMIKGTWSGTMNLTEPHCGTDLSVIKTTATPDGKHYRIEGQKIYITWGDHDMTENVVHLVLAKLPDAPAGIKGISLFLVPKFLLDEQGNPEKHNDIYAISTEHKLGIHGSPTCVMSYGENGGAIGYLVGEPHQGLKAMFTMMNNERLMVGLQGVALAERAYQQAVGFALQRIQGSAPGHRQKSAIIHHPDVRRMLMTMRSITEASRALTYVAAGITDMSHGNKDPQQRDLAARRVSVIIPIVKGWVTELAQEVTSLGIQIHGGMGFVEETGAAQYYRDARILTIYEGTTGIQALDLANRKILLDCGAGINDLLVQIRVDLDQYSDALTSTRQMAIDNSISGLEQSVQFLLDGVRHDIMLSGAISYDLLMQAGYVFGGWQMLRSASLVSGHENKQFSANKLTTAAYYMDHILPRAEAHRLSLIQGSGSVMGLEAEQF